VRDVLTATTDGLDVGDFCRRVEEHLSRVNEGHLVRIVGTGFELVRGWALAGVPFSVVCRGIDMKAERHRAGKATRPLRIEFCEPDVRAVFQDWKRAVGVMSPAEPVADEVDEVRRPSTSKQFDRIVTALTRAAGRLEMSADLRDELTRIFELVVALRETTRGRRRVPREDLAAALTRWDQELMTVARVAAGTDQVDTLRREAAAELNTYRSRMPAEAWAKSVDVATDRLLRERLSLPILEL